MKRRAKRRKKRIRLSILIFIILIGIAAAASYIINGSERDNQLGEEILQNGHETEEAEPVNNPGKNETKPDTIVKISATGDIMFHPSQIDEAYDPDTGTYDFNNSFRAVKSIFDKADLAIANFEGTTAGNNVYAYQGYPLFNAPDEALDAIKNAGFDILSTANNHSLDTRKAGIIRTIEQIKKRGMDCTGTFDKRPDNRVLFKEVKGIKLAFIAYTEMVNGLESVLSPDELDYMINIIDENKIKEDIDYAKNQKADVIIAFMHWGNEYSRIQNKQQEMLSEMMLNEGADIILGSHPHVIQPSKTLSFNGKTKFVAYSMGNFISNQRVETLQPYGIKKETAQYTEDGVIINIDIEKSGSTGEVSIKNIEYIPVWVYKGPSADGKIEHVVYPIMEYIESNELDENSKERMNRSYESTTEQMNVE